jgi:hypothetical protein
LWKAAQSFTDKLGLRLAGIDVGDPLFDYDKALSQTAPDYRGIVFAGSGFFLRDRERLADFAPRNRVVTMF